MQSLTIDVENALKKATYLIERNVNLVNDLSVGEVNNLVSDWKKQGGLDHELFANRLALKGHSTDEFCAILHCRDFPQVQESAKWRNKLLYILDTYTHFSTHNNQIDGIGIFVAPFVQYYVEKLHKELQLLSFDNIADSHSLISGLERDLYYQLRYISSKVVVWDFHRKKEASNTEHFFDTYKEEFLKEPHYKIELFSEMPVLARILVETTESFLTNTVDVLKRYNNDFKEIKELFFVQKRLYLKELKFGLGDPHKGGQNVGILEFEDDTNLVYKPRSLDSDVGFNQFIKWFNQKELKYSLQTLKTLTKKDYGWQEFIEPKECQSNLEVEKYYYRIGALIGVFYALGSNDMHYENIIAAGENPYIIDLETILTNKIIDTDISMFPLDKLTYSVYGSGLLPTGKTFSSKIDTDISGLTGVPQQKSNSLKNWMLVNDNKDDVHFEHIPFVTQEDKHLVKKAGNIVGPSHYITCIQEGLEDIYTIILQHKEELIDTKLDELFADCEYRIVLRPTFTYSRFLNSSFHPKYLTDGLDREYLYEMLWNITNIRPKYKYIVESEIRDLLNNDIPYFSFNSSKRYLIDSRKGKIADVFNETAMELMKEKIKSMGKDDLVKQKRLLSLSLEAYRINGMPIQEVEKIPTYNNEKRIRNNVTSLELSKLVGDYLIDHVVSDDQYSTWMSLEVDHVTDTFKLQSLDYSLYNGISGVVLYLAQLGELTREDKYTIHARKAINYIINKLEGHEDLMPNSMFNGIGALSYTYFYLGVLWNDEYFQNLGWNYLHKISEIEDNPKMDFLDGHSGMIQFCLTIYKQFHKKEALHIAYKYGRDLVEWLERNQNNFQENKIWTGLAHGTSGYILALSALSEFYPTEFDSVILKLIEYEDSLFNEDQLNWKDLRNSNNQDSGANYWCHGAPGIILGRVISSNYNSSIIINEKIHKAIDGAYKNTDTIERICICHGTFGNLDIFNTISKYEEHLINGSKVDSLTYQLLNDDMTLRKLEGMMDRGLVGLLMGVTGVGYSCLRIHDPNIPNIVNLELPKGTVKER